MSRRRGSQSPRAFRGSPPQIRDRRRRVAERLRVRARAGDPPCKARASARRPTRDWNATDQRSAGSARRAATSRAVAWHCSPYGSPCRRIAARDAVKREQQVIEGRARGGDARRERRDVIGFCVIVLDQEPLGRRAPARESRVHPVERRGGRRRRVLRVEREHDESPDACRLQLLQRMVDRGIAVGHAHGDGRRLARQGRELCASARVSASVPVRRGEPAGVQISR